MRGKSRELFAQNGITDMTKNLSTRRTHRRSLAAVLAGLPLVAGATLLAGAASASAAPAVPINDNFANSFPLDRASGQYGSDNHVASVEPGEPDPLPGHPAVGSVWYSWTPKATGPVTFTTRWSDCDTVLAAYTGSTLGSLTQVAVNDDATFDGIPTLQSRITFTATAGVTYQIAIDSATPGDLGVAFFSWVSNDNLANADILDPTIGATVGSNVGATSEAGEPAHAGQTGGASNWYSWTAPYSGTATIDTLWPQFDSLLAVYTGDTLAGLTPIASNDDISPTNHASLVTFAAKAGQTYRIAVDGKAGAQGSFVLEKTLVGPTLSSTGSKVLEGNSGTHPMKFTLKLSQPASTPVTVAYATKSGTATAGSDFIGTAGHVIFSPGQTVKTVTVQVRGDVKKEANETLKLVPTSISGGQATIGAAVNGVITNDD